MMLQNLVYILLLQVEVSVRGEVQISRLISLLMLSVQVNKLSSLLKFA